MENIPTFSEILKQERLELDRLPLEILQVNVGKYCNQACHHCHVEAGPKRTERMTLNTAERILKLLDSNDTIQTVDLTGGAPELHEVFRPLVQGICSQGKSVIDRCNLTVLFEPDQEDTANFLAEHRVQVVASLPCYSKENVDKQRGSGVFNKSIEALRLLNQLGYGQPGTGLVPNLVYNPVGAFLPPAQKKLEDDYKKELQELFGITFNQLFTITNMPIKRFLNDLMRQDKLKEYMSLLVQSFNPQAAEGIMCRSLVSVGYDGQIYDCDFNQMLDIPIGFNSKTIWDIDTLDQLNQLKIAFREHCFGCTAGAGSSCGGSLA